MPANGDQSTYSTQVLRDIIDWDVATWSRALFFWDRHLGDIAGKRVLEIGANHGGLSLHFALKGCDVVCSDLDGPPQSAIELHDKYKVKERIQYESINATNITFADSTFDVVCFKSVLGGIGRGDRYDRQQQTINEIHRILKPGGRLLFAENLVASAIHRYVRRKYVPWGKDWRYVTLDELAALMDSFSQVELSAHGFLAAFGRSESQRTLLHKFDTILDSLLIDRVKYVAVGCAVKKSELIADSCK